MTSLSLLMAAVAIFASTNIDDILLLSALFADPQLGARGIVAGQFLGIGLLVGASAGAAFATLVVPEGWTALLGFVPLGLGLRGLLRLHGHRSTQPAEGHGWPEPRSDGPWPQHHGVGSPTPACLSSLPGDADRRAPTQEGLPRQALTVAALVVANGGDNLGVYIPLFAKAPSAVPTYAAVFAAMTAIWCVLGHALVSHRMLGGLVRRYGRVALPFVLIALGLHILTEARTLLR